MSSAEENRDIPFPEINVELQPPSESIHIIDDVERSFGGKIGRLPLKGVMKFTPRGSSGFDDIPLAEITLYEPPIFEGKHEVSAAPYGGQEEDSAGEVHWTVQEDEAVIESVKRALTYRINSDILPLFES